MKDTHKFVIKNNGKENVVLNIKNEYSVKLMPNELFCLEADAEFPPQLQYGYVWEVEQDFVGVGPIEKTHYWNIIMPDSKDAFFGNWEKEGF